MISKWICDNCILWPWTISSLMNGLCSSELLLYGKLCYNFFHFSWFWKLVLKECHSNFHLQIFPKVYRILPYLVILHTGLPVNNLSQKAIVFNVRNNCTCTMWIIPGFDYFQRYHTPYICIYIHVFICHMCIYALHSVL